ncbi:hypothetical protein [Massilia sp. DWR3-1-1]|uniref:hypothetical protein n=1 Tax=Massilia sp. DWR3-1-1 TaxID=2804559 RepID=UPI003CEF5CFA
MKPRQLVLGATLAVAAAFAFFGDKSAPGELVEAAPRKSTIAPPTAPAVPAARTAATASTKAAAPVLLALVPREQLMAPAMGQGDGGGAFAVQNWTPPPPPPSKPPPPPPVAPPLPFVFLGKAQENGAWEVFLARGSETLIVRQQMVIDGLYRVDAIAPPWMTLTYLPLKQVQQINIGVPE